MQKKRSKSNKKIANKKKVSNSSFKGSEKKHRMHHSSSINMGNLSRIGGKLNIAGGNITTYESTTGLGAAEIQQLFDPLYLEIASHRQASPAEKEDLAAEVKEIQSAMTEASQKDEKIDEGFLSRRFRNIARMAPDVLDIIVKTL
jgi:hypothetical protein